MSKGLSLQNFMIFWTFEKSAILPCTGHKLVYFGFLVPLLYSYFLLYLRLNLSYKLSAQCPYIIFVFCTVLKVKFILQIECLMFLYCICIFLLHWRFNSFHKFVCLMCLALLMSVNLMETLIFAIENKTCHTNKFVFKNSFINWT